MHGNWLFWDHVKSDNLSVFLYPNPESLSVSLYPNIMLDIKDLLPTTAKLLGLGTESLTEGKHVEGKSVNVGTMFRGEVVGLKLLWPFRHRLNWRRSTSIPLSHPPLAHIASQKKVFQSKYISILTNKKSLG